MFKQIQYNPMPVEVQVVVLWAVQNGFVDDVPVDKIKDFQAKLTDYHDEPEGGVVGTHRARKKR